MVFREWESRMRVLGYFLLITEGWVGSGFGLLVTSRILLMPKAAAMPPSTSRAVMKTEILVLFCEWET
ncbi:MAG: hypothetical protein ER33_09030 [Cyanobium sp. CACIAM 14]|nr:MAG: hypothetical protein ER33_09030 [Cyanobium sp. CACIAM 14]